MALSVSFETAISGMRAAQLGIDTAAHNIANVNTQGYSRQEVILPRPQSGGSAQAIQVQRVREVLLDTQYRDVRRLQDQYQARSDALHLTEATLNEPSDHGIQAMLSNFFSGFRDLASQPESISARTAAIESANSLASGLNRTSTMLKNQRTALDSTVDTKVADINNKAAEVADLNAQIQSATLSGDPANDLHDARDLILDQLSGLTGVTVQINPNDVADVYMGARKLVNGLTTDPLTTQPVPANNNLKQVIFASDSQPATVASGELRGILDARDVDVTGMLNSLDTMAQGLISAVNAQHQTGFGLNNATNTPFFTGTDAASIAVNPTIVNSPASLAVSDGMNEPGNSNNAQAIANIQQSLVMNGNTTSVDDYYRSIVSSLGSSSQQTSLLAANQKTLTTHIDQVRQSISGVSINDEMTELVKDQHVYAANAKVITTLDSLLDTLINRMLG